MCDPAFPRPELDLRNWGSVTNMKKILGLVCIILGVGLAIAQFRQEPSATSNDKGNKLTRHSAPVVLFGIGIRLLLAGGSAGSISLSLPKRSGPRDISTGLRGGPNTFASNPAQLDLNYAHWLAANPRHIIFHATIIFAGLVLLFIKWQAGAVLLIVDGLTLWRTRQDMRGKFFRGDVCPGVVLSAEQGLVAILTDLKAAANVARPAIKILKQPLHRIKVYALQDGMRVAAVAEYYGKAQETTWKNFFPEVIPCSVHDAAENQRVLDSIPEAQWQSLDVSLARIPVTTPGLYRLWGENLAADVQAAVPWLHRRPVQIGLIVFAVLGGLIILMQASVRWNERSREQRAQADQVRGNVNPPAQSVPQPAGRATMDLGGKIVTVTNNNGLVLHDITLIRATPTFLTYSAGGQEQRIPLAALPVEFLESLGLPNEWSSYRTGSHAAPPRESRHETQTPAALNQNVTGAYKPGQKIYANWAGRWISGTVIEPFGIGMSYRVQLVDPRFKYPMVLSTNLLRPQ